MKRFALIASALVCLGLFAAGAPALAPFAGPPAPVEFELAAPGGPVAASVVSAPVRTPKRFDLLGFRWSGRGEPEIAVRTRRDGGTWSRWTAVGAHADHAPDAGTGERSRGGSSDPVWAGGADWVQYRMSRRPGGLRLHFVNTTGTATAGDRLRSAIRNGARDVLAFIRGPSAAEAQGQPQMVMRSEWEGGHCAPRGAPSYGEVKAALVHHTVSTNEYLPEEGSAAVLAICRYHRNSNGWDDVGYNFIVDKYGVIYEGRAGGIDRAVIGAQAQGFNAQTTGIANLGTHTDVPQTNAALDAMARLIRWKLPLHGQPTAGSVTLVSGGGSSNRWPSGQHVDFERVSGHRDAGRTACPGEALYAQLPDLRARVGGATPGGPQAARTRIRARVARSTRSITYPGPAIVAGRLRTVSGEVVANAPVEVQHRGPGGWLPVGTAETAGDGTFTAEVSPPFTGRLRAAYFGGEALNPTSSSLMTVRVRPRIEAERSVARARVGQTPITQGMVDPPRSKLLVVIERRVGRRNVPVARLAVRTKEGRFAKGYRVKQPGLYRYRAVFGGDRLNLPGESKPFYIRVAPSDGGAVASRR